MILVLLWLDFIFSRELLSSLILLLFISSALLFGFQCWCRFHSWSFCHWSCHLVFRDAAIFILVIFESLLIIFWSQYYYDLISLFSWDLLSSLIFLLFISSALPFGVQGWCHWVDSLRSVRLIFCDPFGWSFVICWVDHLWSVGLIFCDPLWLFVIIYFSCCSFLFRPNHLVFRDGAIFMLVFYIIRHTIWLSGMEPYSFWSFLIV